MRRAPSECRGGPPPRGGGQGDRNCHHDFLHAVIACPAGMMTPFLCSAPSLIVFPRRIYFPAAAQHLPCPSSIHLTTFSCADCVSFCAVYGQKTTAHSEVLTLQYLHNERPSVRAIDTLVASASRPVCLGHLSVAHRRDAPVARSGDQLSARPAGPRRSVGRPPQQSVG